MSTTGHLRPALDVEDCLNASTIHVSGPLVVKS